MAKNGNRGGKGLLVAAAMLALAAIAILAAVLFMEQSASPSPSPQSGEEAVDSDGFPEVDWEYWQSINPDVIGWVTVPGTSIDYPIVQASSDDPEFYLHHDVYGNYNVYGVPYLDSECAEGGLLHSENAVVLGHHMNDGSMFAAFADYCDYEYAAEHATILLQTPTEKAVLSTLCVDVMTGSSGKRTSFIDDNDFAIWYKQQVEDAVVVLDGDTVPKNLVTFVTCSYLHKNDRTLVLAG